jgi:hypothetical protein
VQKCSARPGHPSRRSPNMHKAFWWRETESICHCRPQWEEETSTLHFQTYCFARFTGIPISRLSHLYVACAGKLSRKHKIKCKTILFAFRGNSLIHFHVPHSFRDGRKRRVCLCTTTDRLVPWPARQPLGLACLQPLLEKQNRMQTKNGK